MRYIQFIFKIDYGLFKVFFCMIWSSEFLANCKKQTSADEEDKHEQFNSLFLYEKWIITYNKLCNIMATSRCQKIKKNDLLKRAIKSKYFNTKKAQKAEKYIFYICMSGIHWWAKAEASGRKTKKHLQ